MIDLPEAFQNITANGTLEDIEANADYYNSLLKPGEVFGGKVVRNTRVMHGKTSAIEHDQQGVFAGLPSPLEVGRYHSLVAQPEASSNSRDVTANGCLSIPIPP